MLKKICAFINTHSPKAKASPRQSAGLSSGTALPSQKDVSRPITSKTPGKVYHEHGGNSNANVINNTFFYMYLSFMISDTCVGLSYA